MTNREWLERLKNKKLATILDNCEMTCAFVDKNGHCVGKTDGPTCKEGHIKWLRRKHKEVEK